MAIASGVLDVVENFFMYQFLEGKDWPAYSFALPATLKFFLVAGVILIILLLLIKRIFFRERS